jgi:uncharacterized protein with HEPN domain
VPPGNPSQRFRDILDNIARIEQYTAGMNSPSFVEDHKTGCGRTLSDTDRKPKLRAFGNVLRHEYDDIGGDRVWFMLEDDLPRLKAASQAALQN